MPAAARILALLLAAFGTKRTLRDSVPMSAIGGKADIEVKGIYFRF